MNDEQNIILKDNFIAIPRCFEIIVVELVHIPTQKQSIFFAYGQVVEKLTFCIPCQSVHKKPKSSPVKLTEISKQFIWTTWNLSQTGNTH